jgi:transketolase
VRGRDRLILSAGHYSIGLWAALAEAGHLDDARLAGYALDGDELIPSTLEGAPAQVELTGGSLGHGLGVAVGLAIGYRMRGWAGQVVNVMTDGELQEGSTWESAALAGHLRLDRLACVVDVNRTQADGDLVLEVEPVVDKWRAFGWWCVECDGNDVTALLAALEASREADDRPSAIVAHTRLGCGVPLIEQRERNHFVRVGADEWDLVTAQLEARR